MVDLVFRAMAAEDVAEVLSVQRSAFTIEARIYADPALPPLLEGPEGVLTDLAAGFGFVAVDGERVVGSVRVRAEGRRLHIARLAVLPEWQGRGIGTTLLALAETAADADEACLFTGHLSEGNLRLYAASGYSEQRRVRVSDLVTLVHLRKPLGAVAT